MVNVTTKWYIYSDRAVLEIKNCNNKETDEVDIPLDIVFCQDTSVQWTLL